MLCRGERPNKLFFMLVMETAPAHFALFEVTIALFLVRGTMLQAGRSRHQDSVRLLNFFNLSNHSSPTMALAFTQPVTEMNSRRSFYG
jgi:hypothetical protein